MNEDIIKIEVYPECIVFREGTDKQRKMFHAIARNLNVSVGETINNAFDVRCYDDNKTMLYDFIYELSKEYYIKVV